MNTRRFVVLSLALCLLMSVVCVAHAAVFAFESAEYNVLVKDTLTLKPILQGAEVSKKATYEWTSSDEEIATVSSKGKVKGVSAGSAVVTCTLTDTDGACYTTQCTINVLQPVTKITFDESPLMVAYGCPYEFKPTIVPEDATNKALRFSSSDENIATVSADGVITGLTCGKCTITVEALDGSGKKLKQKVTVAPFVTDLEDIVLTERKTYRIEMPVSKSSSEPVCVRFPKDLVEAGNLLVDSYWKVYSIDNPGYLLLTPIKAGKGTLTIIDSTGAYGAAGSYFKRSVKLTVEHSAVFDSTSFPKLSYKKYTADPDAYVDQPVSFTGHVTSIGKDAAGNVCYTVATKDKTDDVILAALPVAEEITPIYEGEKVTVYGAFTQPYTALTETGLTLSTPMVIVEKINDTPYNGAYEELTIRDFLDFDW